MLLLAAASLAVVVAAALVRVAGGSVDVAGAPHEAPTPFAGVSSAAPTRPLSLVFIHHSVGGLLLAAPGDKHALRESIWTSHPDGGNLRALLQAQGYAVHEASYGSVVGAHTDRGDWLPKFRDQMDRIFTTALDDETGARNQIVLWKSCFPNNLLDEAGVAAAKKELTALLPLFAQHPDVLFVHLTTPPLSPNVAPEPLWKWLARALTGRRYRARLQASGPLARALDEWVAHEWLAGYAHDNVVVFDLYDALTDHGRSNYLAFVSPRDPYDSHPSRAGNDKVAAELVPFLNRAVRRAGLSP